MAVVETLYYRVETGVPHPHVVRLERTRAPIVEDIEGPMAAVHAVLDRIDRTRACLLVDLRDGPLRNDSKFEQAFAAHRRRMIAGFARVAVLVQTAVGKLQVQRIAREDNANVVVFDDEHEALAHVSSSPRPSRPQL